jgi:replicative DNA helicase
MLDHETALINAILHKESIIDECQITADLFSDATSRALFEAMIETRKRKVVIDAVSWADTLKTTGRPDLIVTSTTYSPGPSSNAQYYVTKLREELHVRLLRPILKDSINMLEQSPEALPDVIKQLADGLVSIERTRSATEDPSIEANLESYLAELERREADDGRSGAVFGIESIDRLLGSNINGGELIGIAARPSVGKTALAVQMAIHNSVYRSIPSTIFSLEMTRNQIYDRIYAPVASGGLGALRNGIAIKTPKTVSGIRTQTARMHEGGVRVYQESMTPASLIASIRREAMVYKAKLFVIDYLGLIDFGQDNRARWEKVGDASRSFKRLALDLNVIIVLCIQLGRQAENKEPTIADLRDSGAIEQDCNRVFLLHRQDDSKDPKADFCADVIIAKNREGARGRANLLFRGSIARFEELRNDRA